MNVTGMQKDRLIGKWAHIAAAERAFRGVSELHFHDFFEIELVLSGEGRQRLNGVEYALERGCVYLLTPAHFHHVESQNGMVIVNVMFDEGIVSPALLTAVFGERQNLFFRLAEEELATVTALAHRLVKETECKDGYTEITVKNLLELILVMILRHAGSDHGASVQNPILADALRYLYTHFPENPPLSRLAAMCGYTPGYFSKKFSLVTGKGYSEFLNILKTNHAKTLLASTGKTAAEIAFLCGFTSIPNFYRVFRAETGMAPLAYREAHGAKRA